MLGLSNHGVRQPLFLLLKVFLRGFVVLIFFSYLWYDYTLTNMNCKTITERLKRVAAIVDGWNSESGVPQIERDIALGELRAIYDALLVVDVDDVEATIAVDAEQSNDEQEIEVEVVIEESEEESEEESDKEPEATEVKPDDASSFESFYDALDIDALLGLTEESAVAEEPKSEENRAVVEPEVVAEPEPEVVAEPEPCEEVSVELMEESASVAEVQRPEPVAEPVVEEPKPVGVGLFDLNDIPVRSKSRRKMISLYSDNPIPTPASTEPVKAEPKVVEAAPVEEVVAKVDKEPVVEPAPVAAQQRLGDSFGEVKTLADQMSKNDVPTTPFNRITELRQAIGLNDKFLMIKELFGGDAARYEATIDTLDEFEDLDECIIYIVENFRWNPDLEAAKLLVSLIERKLA